ncbi:hypothetical protein AVEN_202475-1 [Araneus ventricosus]|uniref:Tc1-like transposase DDE domain-containing protein n=1 Tax=Araneus ventricosus TaxID=182803 RepID=A0A4Y2WJT9_ARAVE|nr:hypothetical protein AVEN_227210-1 [Araneus ventricosus]GBO45469.1 hypothetical protein AVEN_51258-1 [Araneus ventricosus]GBO45471.1 hypothetical protein AVEN_202475-1 [Araneus ventricosus]
MGTFSFKGVGKIVMVNGKMTISDCVDILSENLKKSITDSSVDRWYILQQDNDSKHTSKIVSQNTRLRYWSGPHEAHTLIPRTFILSPK